MTTTPTTPTTPNQPTVERQATAMPPCEVLDQILAWTRPDGTLQIEVGDLILDGGRLKQLDYVALDGESLVGYSFDGEHGVDFLRRDDLVAVRRYITIEE